MRVKINRLQIVSDKKVEKLLDEWDSIHTEIKDLKQKLEDAKTKRDKNINKLLPKMVILEDAAYEYNGIVYKIVQYTAGKSVPYKQVVEFVMSKVNAKLRKEIEEYREGITTRRNPKPTELKTKKAFSTGIDTMISILDWATNKLSTLLTKENR